MFITHPFSSQFCFLLSSALSKPHLLEGKGHNRQSSDSSVDRFIPKEELLEPAELNNKVNTYIVFIVQMNNIVHSSFSQILYRDLVVKLQILIIFCVYSVCFSHLGLKEILGTILT